MRILFVNDHVRITGGADVHCLHLARLLREDGHEVAFLSTRHPENLETQGRFVPLTVTRAARDGISARDALRAASFSLWNPQAARAMKALLDTFRPDVIHAHKLYPQLSVAPVVVAKRQRIPIVQTIHDYEFVSASLSDHTGSWFDHQESRLSYRALNTALFAVKQKVHRPSIGQWITVSRHMADNCRRLRGIEARVIANFADLPSGPLPDYEARDGVLFLGRLAPEKGIRDLLQIAREHQDL
jgi:glycosyltransferase involved in cell wall biosynthesis